MQDRKSSLWRSSRFQEKAKKSEDKKMSNVLIADDSTFMRLMIRKILTKHGFSVIGEAKDGEEVVQQYAKLRPNLVTMDIVMPKLNGIEAVKKIVQFDPDAKIVMVTALGQEQLVIEAIKSGAKEFVIKPFNEAQVVNAVASVSNA